MLEIYVSETDDHLLVNNILVFMMHLKIMVGNTQTSSKMKLKSYFFVS